MSKKLKTIIAISINLVIFGLAVFCLITFIDYLVKGNADNRFRYYTNISNLTVGFISLVNAIVLLITLLKEGTKYPKPLSIIKFIGISMTTLTFFVILGALPFYGFHKAYSGVKIITHLILPIFAVISYIFFEEKEIFSWKLSILGIAPTIIYSIVYITNAVFLGTWPDLYKVNEHGIWYVFVLIAIVSGFVLSQGLYFLKKKMTNSHL